MIIKIDMREKDIYNKCLTIIKNPNIEIKSINLEIGDIIICDNDDNELVIIERKTLADLAASIKDGRYNEQSFRLNNCNLHNHNIYYLIEGNINTYVPYKNRIDKSTLISSMVSISYFKGFSIYKTQNLEESCEWIMGIANKLYKENKSCYYDKNDNSNNIKINYEDVTKRCKKNNIDENNIGIIMLSQIPNVSTSTAKTIMNKYKTIKELIENLVINSKTLDDIVITTKTEKTRKINKTTKDNIYKYLICSN
jgi:ERCC4-type nuclease